MMGRPVALGAGFVQYGMCCMSSYNIIFGLASIPQAFRYSISAFRHQGLRTIPQVWSMLYDDC